MIASRWWENPTQDDLSSVHHALRMAAKHPLMARGERDRYTQLADELWEGFFIANARTDAREADGSGLLSRHTLRRVEGSNPSPSVFHPPYFYESSDHGPVTIYDAVGVGWIARVKESLPHKEELAAAMVEGLNRPRRIVFDGDFELAWLRPDSRVESAGDGTGAAVVVNAEGAERRIDIGDEFEVPL